MKIFVLILLGSFFSGCALQQVGEKRDVNNKTLSSPSSIDSPDTSTITGEIPYYTYRIVNTYPHDPNAFTQGLQFVDGKLFESTGLRGESTLREVDLNSGRVTKSINLADRYFGEGLTVLGDKIYQLTWKSNKGFVYNRNTFEQIAEFFYPTQGWGLTHDGGSLIISDGTEYLYFFDPESFIEVKRISVTDKDEPVKRLNELEYISGEVFANVWQTDQIARIDPKTGNVVGWINLNGLLDEQDNGRKVDVLNGIAYDDNSKRIFVTGKLWPKLFEIEIIRDN